MIINVCVCVCCLPLLFWLTIFHVLSGQCAFFFHRFFSYFSLVVPFLIFFHVLSLLILCHVSGSCSFRSCTYIHALSLRLNSLHISCPLVFQHFFWCSLFSFCSLVLFHTPFAALACFTTSYVFQMLEICHKIPCAGTVSSITSLRNGCQGTSNTVQYKCKGVGRGRTPSHAEHTQKIPMSDQEKPCLKESEDAGDMMKDAGE